MEMRLVSLDYDIPACDTSLAKLPVVIGSAPDVAIRLNDHTVSPHHCRIELLDGKLVVRDLDSLHGTFVNSTRIKESVLGPGDVLCVGALSFFLKYSEETVPRAEPAENRPGHGPSWRRDTRSVGSP